MATSVMGFNDTAALLLERGADPNIQDQVCTYHMSFRAVAHHANSHNYDRTV